MDPSVTSFYTKNPEEGYIDTYDIQHGDRLDKIVSRWGLDKLRDIKLADVGGGLGFLGKRLDSRVNYWVFDGAEHPVEKRVARGTWVRTDIQRDEFGKEYYTTFDFTVCLETVEHLSDPYHCLVQMKTMTVKDAPICISIPTDTVTHNVVYPSLFYPRQNWEVFLAQMALPILDYWQYEPAPGKGWPANCYLTRNADWREARMYYPKYESKFFGRTPLEYTNL